ncbi:MAG: apolipoprotein N-acyltransferase [Candidatus Rokubacteria bacterium RIFCSPLOWO2_02_FULL_72_37]|nr:MAG: apolipoprotein N-acyltransferase [Candidatus Rokubacteria bacterium RIFCSPLOWO2_02_FULL_72_37]
MGVLILRETAGLAGLLAMSALGLALAFPRTDWYGTAWIALTPLLTVALTRMPRAALGWGWFHGTVFFLVLLRWLDHTFQTYSTIPWPLTWLPILALAAYCGLYTGGVAATLAWITRRGSPGWALLTAPFLWVAGEWVRSWLLGGFPWGTLGYSQHLRLSVIQIAELAGVHAVSLVVVAVNAAVAGCLLLAWRQALTGWLLGGFPWGTLGYSQHLRLSVIQIAELAGVHAVSLVVVAVNAAVAGCLLLAWRQALTGILLGGLLLGGTLAFGYARLSRPLPPGAIEVAIMQPSIEQPLKFDPEHAAVTLGIYRSLTERAARDRPDLIVWPETATPTPLRRDPGLVRDLTELARVTGASLLVGSLDVDAGPPAAFRNSAFLLTRRGIVGRYDKIHLVPFGEFVPLSGVIGFVRGWAEFISELEPGSSTVVFPGPPAPFGVVICYEGVFPELVREFVRGGARLMVNMTNDAWFGRTSGPWQHLGMYPLRAVEHRTAIVRAANTGVSAFISPTGQVLRRLDLGSRAVILDRLPLRTTETLYTRFGDWLAWLSAAITAGALAVCAARGVRRAR